MMTAAGDVTATAPQIRLALTLPEAAAAVGLSERGFRRGLAAGRIPAGCRIGSRRVWPIELLRSWLAAGAPSAAKWDGLQGAKGPCS